MFFITFFTTNLIIKKIKLRHKLEEITLNLDWIERLDLTCELAPIAPEIQIQLERHEQMRENQFKGNAKIPKIASQEDPVLNDFKREIQFHRQAQGAAVEGFKKLRALGIPTTRPNDYFAEMAKTDEHMQKVRANLHAKREGQAKSERIRQLRQQRKFGKLIEKQVKVKRVMEKKEMVDQLKKFRKGKLKNLDFLEDDKDKGGNAKKGGHKKGTRSEKRQDRDKKFGFGGKKRGNKRNTKQSSAGIVKNKRLGKSRRTQKKGGGGNKKK